jgi:hypothetical protein
VGVGAGFPKSEGINCLRKLLSQIPTIKSTTKMMIVPSVFASDPVRLGGTGGGGAAVGNEGEGVGGGVPACGTSSIISGVSSIGIDTGGFGVVVCGTTGSFDS